MPISSSAEPAPPGLPRPDPDALVARLRHERAQEGRGKLRIYFGSNAGVGKTYAMLAAAQRERQGGREVLVGLVETHGRKETAQQLHGLEQLRSDPRFVRMVLPGNVIIEKSMDHGEASAIAAGVVWHRYQMPAYHLIAADGHGITLVNIGVGPSNAKTICDHLAVLRPHTWLMIGHCGGLRSTQKIGDFVLAHAYLRDDHVLDPVLPPEVPIPPIAEVQQAMALAAEEVSGVQGANLKQRMRTGTVVTTDDRNWELRYSSSAKRFSQSRAIAIDMESATIATQGYRFRVPYGTLLCVSDKPLHGEIKLPGQANKFYEEAIAAHLQIGIVAVSRLRDEGDRLHSRKLRAFNEPPFR